MATQPFVAEGLRRLEVGAHELAMELGPLPFQPDAAAEAMVGRLRAPLDHLLRRTLILELNAARLRGQLEGDTPEERFRSFLGRLRRREVLRELLEEYPVLARQLVLCIEGWVTTSLELLRRLREDWHLLRVAFSPEGDPGPLVAVEGEGGDRHRGGRSVAVIRFGSGLRVVYKPRSVAVEAHFQELLAWLNARGIHPPFRTLRVLGREGYGWVELVAQEGCQTREEIQRFYRRQGGYLALLYALEATDFHYQNLIAAGELPVLIDLESLFHARVEALDTQISLHESGLLNTELFHTVLRVGLLPERRYKGRESSGVDLSGLGGREGQLSPRPVDVVRGLGTDEACVTRARVPLNPAANRPRLAGEDVDPSAFVEDLVQGFTDLYRVLVAQRGALLAEGGPVARFRDDDVRVIVRNTSTYSQLMTASVHPEMLRDAMERDLLYDRLWLDVTQRPAIERLIPSEQADLWRGDVPFFSARPSSRSVWTSTGEELKDSLREPSLDTVEQRMNRLDEEDLKRQAWFIRASLATHTMRPLAAGPSYDASFPGDPATPEALLTAARAVGDRLEALAQRWKDEAIWVGLQPASNFEWDVGVMDLSLYSGLPGAILFLAYLGALTGEERHTALARAALNTLRRDCRRGRAACRNIGAFSGWGGILYLLAHLSSLWGEPALREDAEAIVAFLPAMIREDTGHDLVFGAAGCIAGLLSLHGAAASPAALDAAALCAERLVAAAQPMRQGIGWLTPAADRGLALAGFSHGASGISWALAEIAAVTGQAHLRRAARESIAYERTLFVPAERNWADLRDGGALAAASLDGREPGQNFFSTAWCHGAPGIGLSRLRLLPLLGDERMRDEIDIAVATTLKQGFGRNHSLCHGDTGNLDFLLSTGRALGDARLLEQAGRGAAMVLRSISSTGWSCGVPLGMETPGLMAGLAGIGYGLLRLAAPDRVPSVLALEPPLRPGPRGVELCT